MQSTFTGIYTESQLTSRLLSDINSQTSSQVGTVVNNQNMFGNVGQSDGGVVVANNTLTLTLNNMPKARKVKFYARQTLIKDIRIEDVESIKITIYATNINTGYVLSLASDLERSNNKISVDLSTDNPNSNVLPPPTVNTNDSQNPTINVGVDIKYKTSTLRVVQDTIDSVDSKEINTSVDSSGNINNNVDGTGVRTSP